MKVIRNAFALLGLMLLAGCITQPPPQARSPFPAFEYAILPQSGTGVVEGQVFMRTVGGDVKFGAGSPVLLGPVTSYTEEWYNVAVIRGLPIGPADPALQKYTRQTQADGNGNFQFTDVPPGQYFLVSEVFWQAPTHFGLARQGGVIVVRVTAEDGRTTRQIVTR